MCKKYNMDMISLIAPTSHERISMIAKEASGFVYCVSSLGVTGARSEITTDIGAMVKLVKKGERYPMCGRLRNLHTGAGKEDGRTFRRCYRWFRNREALRNVWKGRGSVCEGICEVDV